MSTRATAADKLRLAQTPPPPLHQGEGSDVGVGALRLEGKKLSARIENSITSASLERTMDGASTLRIDVQDQAKVLMRSGLFNTAVTVEFDRLYFRLVQVRKQDDTLQLTFEDREVAWLRKYKKPRKAFRDRVTRAQFVRQLVMEVTEGPIGFYAPELKVKQAIRPPDPGSTPDPVGLDPNPAAEYDFSSGLGSGMTVKGVAASPEQVNNINRVLAVSRSLGAQPKAELALVMACIAESQFRNLTGGHSSSVGILQLLDIHLNGSTALQGGRRDIELVARLFLTQGFTGAGSAISLAARLPDASAAQIASLVQGNADGVASYEPWEAEAKNIINIYDPSTPVTGDAAITESSPASAVASPFARYEFSRGEPGKPEDSWTAIQRLAKEVGWRAFMVAGTLYFISDRDLLASRPRMRITEASPGIDRINWDWDIGKPVARASVTCRASLWSAPPGSVVVLEESGPANGRWLVQSSRRSLFSTDMTIELVKAQPKLGEPRAEAASSADAPPVGGIPTLTPLPRSMDPNNLLPTALGSSFGVSPHRLLSRGGGPEDHAQRALGNWQSDHAYDLMGQAHQPIYLPYEGTVTNISGSPGGNPGFAGYGVTIDDSYFYKHLGTLGPAVRVGARLPSGALLGTLDPITRGGPHLHLGAAGHLRRELDVLMRYFTGVSA